MDTRDEIRQLISLDQALHDMADLVQKQTDAFNKLNERLDALENKVDFIYKNLDGINLQDFINSTKIGLKNVDKITSNKESLIDIRKKVMEIDDKLSPIYQEFNTQMKKKEKKEKLEKEEEKKKTKKGKKE